MNNNEFIEDTFHIHITGIVQGIGFRPFVYKLAKQFKLNGWVNNSNDGVHIEFNSDELSANKFYKQIVERPPLLSKITNHSLYKTSYKDFNDFEIIESKTSDEAILMLTPDFAICSDCKKELYNINDRRYQHPFITCTHCGPRYSVIRSLPYDRQNTTMHDFEICENCDAEYYDAENRRHYSQTNSCDACGITMEMYSSADNKIATGNTFIIGKIIQLLKQGKIIAVKGIGGYLLLCDAGNAETVKTLRLRKHRPAKPFAVMFKDIDTIEKIASINGEERDALQSVTAPIVLIEAKNNTNTEICMNEIAPGLSRIGAMLPYAPLFELILSKYDKPLIATSANISDSPIIYDDVDALQSLFNVADFVITNNRQIVVPQDDSVIQFSKIANQKIIIRRSRGLAPSYFNYNCNTHKTVLATGALLKSSFTFVNKKNVYISQYLGNTESYEAQEAYIKTANHFLQLFNKKPGIILTDKHPQYFSNQFAQKLAAEMHIEVKEIQHHKAHFAAALAENNLVKQDEAILGVIWDGTGFGDDKNIWGGEFFVYENKCICRSTHFDYFPSIVGDKMPKEPRISALSVCNDILIASDILRNKFTDTEWNLYQQLSQQAFLQCSSVGRIFDAVASLLNLCDKQSYEGEAALLLQEQALKYFNDYGWLINESYYDEKENPGIINTSLLIKNIISDINENQDTCFIAAKFHFTLVQIIKSVADRLAIKKIAFSGGVFQNSVLVDLIQLNIAKEFELYFNKEISPNDENISFGQFVYYDNNIKNTNNKSEKIKETQTEEIINY